MNFKDPSEIPCAVLEGKIDPSRNKFSSGISEASFNCIAKEEEFLPKLFIEASAGTGKTFVIEHYVTRAVLEASSRGEFFDPKQFAIITFTKAVARELRTRIQKALKKALLYFQGDAGEPDVEYYALYPDKKTAARSLSLFLEGLSTASITTIHGFCERLLTIWSEKEGEEVMVWESNPKKWLQEFLEEASFISTDEWNILAKQDGFDHDYFLNRVLSLMDDPLIEETPSKEECLLDLKNAVEAIRTKFPSFISETASLLQTYAKQFRGNCTVEGDLHEEKKALFEALQILLEEFSEKRINPFLKLRINLALLFETPLRGYTPLEGGQYSYFLELLSTLWPKIHALIDPESLRKRIAREAARAFFSYAATHKKKTFEILVRTVLTLSHNERFCKEAASSFSWVIVDEFQDTDPTQLAIFKTLFLHNEWNGKILFVGDPKQAIYGFRKADVYSYMKAKVLLEKSVRTLSVNYRASQPLVEALNILFSGPESPFIFYLPKNSSHLATTPNTSAAHIEPLQALSRGALHVVRAKASLGRKRNWPHEEIEKQFFSWMHDEIVSLHEEGISFKQQAVLVKDRYQARRVEEFLRAKNIPTCSWRLDLVTESQVFPFLKKIFLILLNPNDKKKLLTLLYSMVSQEEICREIALENNLTTFALAAVAWGNVRDAFYSGGMGALKRELYSCRYNGREPLELYVARQEKELAVDLEQLLDSLSLLEEKLPRDLGAFYDALTRLEEYFSEDRDVLLRRVDPDDEGVPILTMHRSKGLEFDVVYALGVSSRTPQTEGDLEEIDAEKLRQMYVALTRAKRRCYLPLFHEEEGKKIPRGRASPAELLLACHHVAKTSTLDFWADSLYQSMSSDIQEEVINTLVSAHPGVITASSVEESKGKTYRNQDVKQQPTEQLAELLGNWRKITSFSQLKEKGRLTIHPSLSSGGALLGLQFHEAIDFLLSQEPSCTTQEAIEAIYGKGELASLLYSALHVELPTLARLDMIPRESLRTEVPFLFTENERHVSGTIDLLFVFQEKVYVIDWKTQEVDIPLQDYVKEAQYDLQASLYKKGVENAFPNVSWGGFFFVFVKNLMLGKESVFLCS